MMEKSDIIFLLNFLFPMCKFFSIFAFKRQKHSFKSIKNKNEKDFNLDIVAVHDHSTDDDFLFKR